MTRSPPPLPRRQWAYFFDMDGTLVDLTDPPATLRLDRGLLRLIATYYELTGGALALISSRSPADIDRLFPRLRLPVAGHHGIERRSATGTLHRHGLSALSLKSARDQLAAAAATWPGLVLEDKGSSLALHYRGAPGLASCAHRAARTALRRIGTQYTLLAGKRVVEIRPTGRDKGIAVFEFMQEPPFYGRTPVFLGDDVTDEFGFDTVNRLRGYSIKVGPGRTLARWRLRDAAATKAWLLSIAP